MNSIKIKRAYNASRIGRSHVSRQAMLSYVPESVIAGLTGRQLGELLDGLWTACQDAKAILAREACNGQGVWDEAAGRHRSVAAA